MSEAKENVVTLAFHLIHDNSTGKMRVEAAIGGAELATIGQANMINLLYSAAAAIGAGRVHVDHEQAPAQVIMPGFAFQALVEIDPVNDEGVNLGDDSLPVEQRHVTEEQHAALHTGSDAETDSGR